LFVIAELFFNPGWFCHSEDYIFCGKAVWV
jgi:hypothetical protein